MEESVGEEGEDCRGVSAEGDRACHVDAEAAEEEDELPAARLRGMEVEAGLGRLAKRAGLAVLGGDPAVLEDVAEDRGGIEGEASEGRFASAVAESGISGEVGGAVVVLEDAPVSLESKLVSRSRCSSPLAL